jgi:SAM-dependent methyltransferase
MNAQDRKLREKQSYDDKNDERPYGSLWDSGSLDRLYELSAIPAWNKLLEGYAVEGDTLDIGCGGGAHVEKLQHLNPDRQVIGIEISREQLEKSSGSIRPHLIQGDGEQLPFKSDRFESVITRAALHHLPNWDDDFLQEIKRVMKPGGTFVFWEPGKYNPPAAVRRRFFPSDSHTPDESPFNPDKLESVLKSEFPIADIQGHYVISNGIPVISKFSPIQLSYIMEPLVAIEDIVPFSRQFSWILTGYAKYE